MNRFAVTAFNSGSRVFPAQAGMNRRGSVLTYSGLPVFPAQAGMNRKVFPAQAGMNCQTPLIIAQVKCSPHRRG